jgi:hypothetical protein
MLGILLPQPPTNGGIETSYSERGNELLTSSNQDIHTLTTLHPTSVKHHFMLNFN